MKTQPEYVTGDGGNSTITNQDEQTILDACFGGVPAVAVGYQEDDSHVSAQFRGSDVAGS
jgi:hypothetical protein